MRKFFDEVKRENKRCSINFEANYTLNDCTGKCIIYNISKNGAMFKTSQILLVGDKIVLLLNYDGNIVELAAEIRYVNNLYVGILFTNIESYEKVVLECFIEDQQRMKKLVKTQLIFKNIIRNKI